MMSVFVDTPRRLKRLVGLGTQMLRDLVVHRRYRGTAFPSLGRRVLEQSRLLMSSAVDAEDYYCYGLYRPSLPFPAKAAFLGYWEKNRYFDLINPPVYDLLARDKALFHMLAVANSLPIPEVLASTVRDGTPAVGLRLRTEADLRAFLERPNLEHVFLKPVDGKMGEGALSLGARLGDVPRWQRLPVGDPVDLEDVMAHVRDADGRLQRYLLQRRLRPHPSLDAIVPEVCPTIRLMSYTEGGTSHFLGAALRMGNGSSPTDNLSGGGVVAGIDYDTGVLRSAVSIDSGLARRTEVHPVTGRQIVGVTLPDWQDIRRLALESAQKFSFLPCIAWDIGITDKGPVIIEINSKPQCRAIQMTNDHGLLDGVLGRVLARHDGIVGSGLSVAASALRGAWPEPATARPEPCGTRPK